MEKKPFRLSKREFLLGLAGFSFVAIRRIPEVSAYPIITDDQESESHERIQPLSRGGIREVSPLQEYFRKTSETQRIYENILLEKRTLEGFRGLTKQKILDNFNYGFKFYYGAYEKFNIPWQLLWIIHEHETNASTERYPERNGYFGAMQRDPDFYPEKIVKEAASGWEFLGESDQRYSKKKGFKTNDFEEIFFAAWKIRNDAERIKSKNPSISDEEAVLQAQYSYCSRNSATQRINQYRFITSQINNS